MLNWVSYQIVSQWQCKSLKVDLNQYQSLYSVCKTWYQKISGRPEIDIILFLSPWKRGDVQKKISLVLKSRRISKKTLFVKFCAIWKIGQENHIICCTECLFHDLEHILTIHAPRKSHWSTDITEMIHFSACKWFFLWFWALYGSKVVFNIHYWPIIDA